MAVTSVFC